MSPRQRYLECMLFGEPDRVPLTPGGPRESTLQAWHAQGLEPDAPWFPQLLDAIGLAPDAPVGIPWATPGVSFRMIPEYEEEILEHRDGHYILRDWMGAIVEISDQYDASYLRAAKDFVTRKWYRFPVEAPEDFEAMRIRYDANDPRRYPAGFADRMSAMDPEHHLVTLVFNGPFWQLREWCGFEGLCMLFLDQPQFVRHMVSFWREFVSGVMSRVAAAGRIDRILINEDMAYKAHAMISPAMTAEFLGPAYREWVSIAEAAGCQVFEVDSDGYVGDLMPVWIDCGINACSPMEVAAGNDLAAFRREHGERMAFCGGIDKRALARGGEAMRDELNRVVPPLLATGGFIPGCDHGVPPDISWPNFIEYSRVLGRLCGWL
ncbi:MAG: uroporphyrinogen decarboxylase family protein [Armatimonadota bacterium]|jgi:hypothetical protein|nr:hypothetical protein [Acidobacteriota bacterium]